MKKYLLSAGVVLGLLLSGCGSNQPQLEAVPSDNSAQTSVNQQGQQSTEVVQSDANVAGEESVSTDNANVTEEGIETQEIAKETKQKPQFIKSLASTIVYFDFDKYNIKASEWPKVEKLAELLKSNNSNYTIRIEGNCDEWGTEEYNYALGLKRADSVKKALIKLGVDPKKLTVISYGELNPVCKAHTKSCWEKNRRDNFTYLH